MLVREAGDLAGQPFNVGVESRDPLLQQVAFEAGKPRPKGFTAAA
jgi:hypothetical protein